MKKQLLLLALTLGTTSQILSWPKQHTSGEHPNSGQNLFNFITQNGVHTLSQADQSIFADTIKRVKEHHPKQLNGYYSYGGLQMTPLMLAAYYVNPAMVNLLLKSGADASLTSQGELQTQAMEFISLPPVLGEKDPLKTQLHTLKNPSSIVYTRNGNDGTNVTTTAAFDNSRLNQTTALLMNTGN